MWAAPWSGNTESRPWPRAFHTTPEKLLHRSPVRPPRPLVRDPPREELQEPRDRSCVRLTLFVPVGADPEPHHVGHDQQRRVLQRQRILPELVERESATTSPGNTRDAEPISTRPDVGPAVAAGVPARSSPSRWHRSMKCSCDPAPLKDHRGQRFPCWPECPSPQRVAVIPQVLLDLRRESICGVLVQITIRSISSTVTVSAVRS